MTCSEGLIDHRRAPGADACSERRVAGDPDGGLVERLRRREPDAVETLVAAYAPRVYRVALRLTGDVADAEEVTQDALWTASRKIDGFRGDAAFGSWVYRITANTAYQKRRARRTERSETSWEDLAPIFDENRYKVSAGTDWSSRLDDPALATELQSVLRAAIDELPGEHRTACILHDVEGLPNPEIADGLRVKLATVKSRVHRARLFLRARLAAYVGRGPQAA
ncbi:MAG TPA: sigma-70 family RNA polymerase sigma factor [Methylomirabilota bacterium]|nr:sigma-70 family RNA polymerase sigma factor [Methylomirabilota bacterium]